MYVYGDPKTKKALREMVASALANERQPVRAFQPGPFGDTLSDVQRTGWYAVEGPQYPKAHAWYAQVRMVDGVVVEVKK